MYAAGTTRDDLTTGDRGMLLPEWLEGVIATRGMLLPEWLEGGRHAGYGATGMVRG